MDSPVKVFPLSQVELKRQIPYATAGPHVVVQHMTSEGSSGQNPARGVPSVTAQVEVVTQIPGIPPASHGSWIAARTTIEREGTSNATEARLKRVVRMVCFLVEGLFWWCWASFISTRTQVRI
jgi:hypothetical protein